jgi:hypothetical protein
MLGPCDFQPGQSKVAVTFRYVYESGRHYVVMSFGGGKDDWQRVQINDRQVAGFIEDGLPKVLRKQALLA